jgi:acyl carrier protein
MTRDACKPPIRNFLATLCDVSKIEDGDNIFEKKILNSLYAMQLVLFVEKNFSIKVEDSDLKRENFQSIEAIAALVAAKTTKV